MEWHWRISSAFMLLPFHQAKSNCAAHNLKPLCICVRSGRDCPAPAERPVNCHKIFCDSDLGLSLLILGGQLAGLGIEHGEKILDTGLIARRSEIRRPAAGLGGGGE